MRLRRCSQTGPMPGGFTILTPEVRFGPLQDAPGTKKEGSACTDPPSVSSRSAGSRPYMSSVSTMRRAASVSSMRDTGSPLGAASSQAGSSLP